MYDLLLSRLYPDHLVPFDSVFEYSMSASTFYPGVCVVLPPLSNSNSCGIDNLSTSTQNPRANVAPINPQCASDAIAYNATYHGTV